MAPDPTPPPTALRLLAGILILAGCIPATTDLVDLNSYVTFDFQGLQPLDGGLKYQAWAVREINGIYVGDPILVFNVNGRGELLDPVQNTVITEAVMVPVPKKDLYGIGISIELTEGDFVSSSSSYLLGGVVEKGPVQLEFSHWTGLGSDLSGISGSFLLATPTDSQEDEEFAGIWFLDPSGPVPGPGLSLPDPGDGWDYEAWVVVGSDTLSTGKFTLVSGADETDRYCGTHPGPGFPGEDFLANPPPGVAFPLDLQGAEVFVTLEPWERWDVHPESPFFVRLMEAQIPQSALPGQSYPMNSLFDMLPKGTARVR
jgi:hypothetical protein